jgi:hypothetical protein
MQMPHGEDLYAAVVLCVAGVGIWGSLVAMLVIGIFR